MKKRDTSAEAVEELLWQAEDAPYGPTKVAMVEEAVRLADTLNNEELGMQARTALVEAAIFSGQGKKALVAFTWCLAQHEKNPDRYDDFDLLWQYKWIANQLADFAEISRAQIENVFADMEQQYQKRGVGLKPVFKIRCNAAMTMGEPEKARHWLQKWLNEPNTWASDCRACEVDSEAALHLELGDFSRAQKLARPIVETRKLSCSEIPHLTFARMAAPCLAHGLAENAAEYHARGYSLVRNNPEFVEPVGQHMSYLAAAGKPAEGLKLIERHLPWLAISGSTVRHYRFFCGTRAVLASAIAKGLKDSRKLRLPKSLPIYRESGEYSLSALLKWADAELDGLTKQLDTRNGNNFYAAQVAALRASTP